MDHRRPFFRTLAATAALLSLATLELGVPAQARSGVAGLRPAAPASSVPRTSPEHSVSDLPVLNKSDPAVASNGTTSLVVWSDYLGGPVAQIHAARRTSSGTVLDEIVISPSSAAQTSPSVAYNGTNFFVVWQEAGDLFGTRVTPSGSVLDGYGIPVAISRATGFSKPAVASNGAGFLVAWIGQGATIGETVFAKRITGAGQVLDGGGFEIGSAGLAGGSIGGGPAVASNGLSYLVVWSADSCPFCGTLLGSRVTTSGSVLNPGGFPISKDSSDMYFNEYGASVSARGTEFVVGWTAERCTEPGGNDCRHLFRDDVLAGRVSASGTVLGASNITVAVDTGVPAGVSIASTAATSLVVWTDVRSGAGDVYAARVSAAGALLDPSGIRLSTGPLRDSNPAVARSGTGFVAAWQSGVDIVGAGVDETGTVLAPHATVLSAGRAPLQSAPDVASDGFVVVAVWRESRPGMPDTIRVGRSLPDGTPTSGEGTVIASGFDLGDPAISSGGQQELVVWAQDEKIYGARLQSGGVIDTTPFVVSAPRPQFTFPRSPAVAWNGTAYLVTWADDDAGNLDVFGARVNPAGTVLDATGLTVASAPGDQDSPTVASDGHDFFVGWQDLRSGSGSDIYGSRVSGAGAILEPTGLPVSTAAGDQSDPDVAWNGSRYVVVWQDGRSPASVDIFGTRVSAAGVVTNAAGNPISTAVKDQSRPTASRTGTDVLVVWEDRRKGTGVDLFASRVSMAGLVRDPNGLVVSNRLTDEVDPASASMNNGRVVVGYQRTATGAPYRVRRAFFRITSSK